MELRLRPHHLGNIINRLYEIVPENKHALYKTIPRTEKEILEMDKKTAFVSDNDRNQYNSGFRSYVTELVLKIKRGEAGSITFVRSADDICTKCEEEDCDARKQEGMLCYANDDECLEYRYIVEFFNNLGLEYGKPYPAGFVTERVDKSMVKFVEILYG